MHYVITFLGVYLSLADLRPLCLGAGGDVPVTCNAVSFYFHLFAEHEGGEA